MEPCRNPRSTPVWPLRRTTPAQCGRLNQQMKKGVVGCRNRAPQTRLTRMETFVGGEVIGLPQ
jgi:hypothetical protein